MRRNLERPKRPLSNIWLDQSGASSAEYAVILAVVGAALVMAVSLLSLSIIGGVDDATVVIESTAINGNGANGQCDNNGLGTGSGGGAGGGGGQGAGSGVGNTCP
jgi:pilus assembly protein Flp/PilA